MSQFGRSNRGDRALSYKPAEFFLSVIDFLVLLVPGAVLLFALTSHANIIFGVRRLFPALSDPSIQWAAFAFMAYILGHLVDSIASPLLDKLYDHTYRNLQRYPNLPNSGYFRKLKTIWKLKKEVWKLADYKVIDPLRFGARKLMSKQIADLSLDPNELAKHNLLMWSQSYVKIRSSFAAAEVERYQANSKFFRSMTIVLLLLILLSLFNELPSWSLCIKVLIMFGLSLLFCYRFMVLRWTATVRTYEYYLLLLLENTTSDQKD